MTLNKRVLVTPTRNQVQAPTPTPKRDRPNPLQTVADAAIRENPIAATVRFFSDAVDRTNDVNVPGFDAFEDNEGTVFEGNPELLIGVLSPEEKERVRIKAEGEVARLERIDAAGPLGIILSVASGLLDPLILIPVGGQIRKARTAIELSKLSKTAKAAELGKIALTGSVPADLVGPLTGAVTTARAGILGASASELVLQADQDMRTYGESVLNVASSAVLSGLLGGVVSNVSAKTRRAALRQLEHDLDEIGFVRGGTSEKDITLTPEDLVNPTDGSPTGAEIKIQNALGLDNLMAKDGLKHAISPFVRVIVRSKSLEAKKTIMKLVDSPVRTEGFNPGSSAEAEILGNVQSGMFHTLSERSSLYTTYRTRIAKERGESSATIKEGGRLRSGVMKVADVITQRRKSAGDLSEAEFEELAGSSYRFEDSGIPEVDEYGRVWGEIFDKILDDGISDPVALWPEIVREMGPKGARNFLSRVYKQDELLVDEDIFKSQKIKPWLMGAMDDEEIDAILKNAFMDRVGEELGGPAGLGKIADDVSREPTTRDPVFDEPLGMKREPVLDFGLARLSPDEFGSQRLVVRKRVDNLERQLDENLGIETRDAEFRRDLIEAQDKFTEFELEDFRRLHENAEPEDLAFALRQIGEGPDEMVKALLLSDIIAKRGVAEQLRPHMEEFARRSPDHAEVLSGKIERFKEVIDTAKKDAPVETKEQLVIEPSKISEGTGLSTKDVQDLTRAFIRGSKGGNKRLLTLIDEREKFTPRKAREVELRIQELIKEEGLHPKFQKAPEIPDRAHPKTPDSVSDEGIAPMLRRSFTPDQQKALDDAIDGHVSTIFENLTTSTRGRINYGKVAGATGSPFKERRLTWRDEDVKDYLEQNITVLGERYLQTVVPDIAIKRRFGSLDLDDVLGVEGTIAKDYIAARSEAKTPAEIRAVQKQQKEDRQIISDVLKIFRGTYNNPPDNTLVSIGRALKAGNYTIFGGGFGLNSFPDVGMPVMRNGFLRAFKTGYKPFITHLESAKLSKKEAQTFGAAIEWEMDARSNQLWGVGDYVARNRVERAAKSLSSKMSFMNLMTPWNSTMKGISANVSMTRSIEAILAEPKGTAGMGARALKKFNEEIATLEFYRLPAPMRARIRKMLEEPGGMFSDGDLKWSNTQAWSDRKAAEEFGRSIRVAVDNTILTPGVGGVPTWLKKEENSIIFQFQTFGFGATNTILLSSAQALSRRDVDSMVGLAIMIGAGTVVEWTKNQINDRPNPSSLSRWVSAGIDRSGALGAYGQGINIIAKISGNEAMSSRFAARNILSSMLGPSLGTAETLFTVGTAAARGEMSDSEVRQARRLIPYNQIPYWQWLFDQMEETTVDTFSLPRKRRRKRRIRSSVE